MKPPKLGPTSIKSTHINASEWDVVDKHGNAAKGVISCNDEEGWVEKYKMEFVGPPFNCETFQRTQDGELETEIIHMEFRMVYKGNDEQFKHFV